MIFKIIDPKKGILKYLDHIPPAEEEKFWEKNKDNPNYIRVNIFTAFPDCIRFDINTKHVYTDLNCVHQKRIKRKLKEFSESTKQTIEKYLINMDWGTSYYECISEVNSTLQFLEKNKDKYPAYYNYVSTLHATIEEIWLEEQKIEQEIKKTKTYAELQRYDSYQFISSKVEPRLKRVYEIYVQCKANQGC
jgi:hypothetical protein